MRIQPCPKVASGKHKWSKYHTAGDFYGFLKGLRDNWIACENCGMIDDRKVKK